MRRWLRSLIPSLFQRRLLLLAGALALPMLPLAAQLLRLGVVEHARLLDAAEAELVERRWTPTVRGRVLDRRGRVLAANRPSYAVEVDYRVLDGSWPARTARALAPRIDPQAWEAASPAERESLAASLEARLARHAAAMWDRLARVTGVKRDKIDDERAAVLARVERMHDVVSATARRRLLRERAAAGLEISDDVRRSIDRQADAPIAEQRAAHPILAGLPDAVGFDLLAMSQATLTLAEPPGDPPVTVPLLPGTTVTDTAGRVHPYDGLAVEIDARTLPGPLKADRPARVEIAGALWHVLGDVRRGPRAEDLDARRRYLEADPDEQRRAATATGADRGEYRPGDLVGHRGVERLAEHRLRGLRGVLERDRATGTTRALEPAPGRDVRLTIDAEVQARVAAALDPALGLTRVQPWHDLPPEQLGETLNGAAVVLDIDTGDILAMLSTPAPTDTEAPADPDPDPDPDPGAEPGSEPDPRRAARWSPDPYVNRAIAAAYPPGSIAKAFILPEAVSRGRLTLGTGVVCSGHLLDDRDDLYRCWIFKRFGATHSPFGEPLLAADALKVSCNIFFYEMGRRLGVDGVIAAYEDFGVGRPFELGIGPEWPGGIGSTVEPGLDAGGLSTADAILMAIGQGPVSWSPLHAACAYATLARGGVHIAPRLIDSAPRQPPRRVELDQRGVAAALDGLWLAVNDPRGTGATIATANGREPIFNVPGVRVWGKTGTATAPPIVHDPDGPDGPSTPRVVRSGDHAWFLALAGPEGGRPTVAAAVIIEYGGSGGRVAGPVMNQVLHALAGEGYLGPRTARGLSQAEPAR